MTELYVLFDANDPGIDWDSISANISIWKISIGTITPKLSDSLKVGDADVSLLLALSGVLVADTNRYASLCVEEDVPLILITKDTKLEEIKEKIGDRWWDWFGADNSDRYLEYLGDVHS